MPTVLVTGANRGLGLEFVQQYAADGWTVIAACRDPGKASELQATAQGSQGRVKVEAVEITDHASIDALATKYRGTPIDVLINNAGIIGPVRRDIVRQSFGSMDYAEWQRVLQVNLFGPMKVSEAFADNVAASDQKKIATISSTVGSNVEHKAPVFAYASSKAAVTKVMGLMADALKPRGVICLAFCPGHVMTDMGGRDANVHRRDSIAGMRQLLAAATMAKSGSFTRYNGETVAY